MQNIGDIFKIGDTVISILNNINPLLCYEEQRKIGASLPEAMPIDVSWLPPFFQRPDPKNTKVFLNHKDRLTILSKALIGLDYPSYIFKVCDQNGNQYYLSCEWIEPEPIQLSLFEEL